MKNMYRKLPLWILEMLVLILLLTMSACSESSPQKSALSSNKSTDAVQLKEDESFTNEIADNFVKSIVQYARQEAAPESSHLIIVRSAQLDFYSIRYYCYCYDDTDAYTGLLYAELLKNSQAVEQHRKYVGDGFAIIGNGFIHNRHGTEDLPFIGTDYNTALSKIGNATNFFADSSSARIDCPNPDPIYNIDIQTDTISRIEHDNAVPGPDDYLLTVMEHKSFKGEPCDMTTDYTFDPETMQLTSLVETYDFEPEVDVLHCVNYTSLNERRLQNGFAGYFQIIDDPAGRTVKIAYNKNYFNEFSLYTSYDDVKAHCNEDYIICDTYENGKQN